MNTPPPIASLLERVEREFPLPPASLRPLRVGLIGLGFIASASYVPALQFLRERGWAVEVGAYCDIDAARRLRFGELYPRAEAFADGEELLARAEIDAVFLLTFPLVMERLLPAALRRGLAIFAEKPVSHRPQFFAEIGAAARAARAPLQVGYNRRHQILAEPFRRMVREIGPVTAVRARFWRAERSEPLFYEDTVVHALDFLESQFGRLEPVGADVVPWPASGAAAPPWAALTLRLRGAGGLDCELDCRPSTGHAVESYEAIGFQRSAALTYLADVGRSDPARVALYQGGVAVREQVHAPASEEPEAAAYIRGFLPQIAAFCRLAAGEAGEVGCGLAEAARAQDLYHAAVPPVRS